MSLLIVPARANYSTVSLPDQITAKILKNEKAAIADLKVNETGDGHIVLQGITQLFGAKLYAQKVAQKITGEKFGINTIENNIVVKPFLAMSDTAISNAIFKKVARELIRDYFEDVNFAVENGTVKLFGTVRRLGLIDKIYEDVIWVPGVMQVENNLRMTQVSFWDDRIRVSVLRAMMRDIRLSTYFIQSIPSFMILVDGGRVTLKGNVNSREDIYAAEQVTRGIFGVFGINDQLRVSPHS
jgi:osmotically-inducible protein OsmY